MDRRACINALRLLLVIVAGGAASLTVIETASAAGCAPRLSKYQRQVEQRLKLPVDGKATVEDCVAIRTFQQRYDVRPANGYASHLTLTIATRLARAQFGKCPRSASLRICVDLTNQVMWVMQQQKVIFGPVPVRTGRRGMATPARTFQVLNKKLRTARTYSGRIMPYWQRFHGRMGFHQSLTWLYDPRIPGSHGCINLLSRDARVLFSLTKVRTPVYIFGRKPGT